MEPARFWELIDTLGGVADDETTPALHESLVASGEGEAFRSMLDDLVKQLLDGCDLPPLYRGDTAEWIAAAVVARGRDVYERVLAAGVDLDPGEWAWEEAEALLVVGFEAEGEAEHDEDDEDDEDAWRRRETRDVGLGTLLLEWKTDPPPPDVLSGFDPEMEEFMAVHSGALIDIDDPRRGHPPVQDPEWDRALDVLAADPQVRELRGATMHVGVHVLVKDSTAGGVTRWEDDGALRHVTVEIARAAVEDPGGRAEVYETLLRRVLAQLAEEPPARS